MSSSRGRADVALDVALGVALGVVVGVGVQVGKTSTGKIRVLISPEFTVQMLGFSPTTRARPVGNQRMVDHSPGIKPGNAKHPSTSVLAYLYTTFPCIKKTSIPCKPGSFVAREHRG